MDQGFPYFFNSEPKSEVWGLPRTQTYKKTSEFTMTLTG